MSVARTARTLAAGVVVAVIAACGPEKPEPVLPALPGRDVGSCAADTFSSPAARQARAGWRGVVVNIPDGDDIRTIWFADTVGKWALAETTVLPRRGPPMMYTMTVASPAGGEPTGFEIMAPHGTREAMAKALGAARSLGDSLEALRNRLRNPGVGAAQAPAISREGAGYAKALVAWVRGRCGLVVGAER